jgi:SPP1 family predicted phage head-tail adaptor
MPPPKGFALDAGRLDRVIGLQSWQAGSDPNRQPRGAWGEWAQVRAEVIELPGSEPITGGQLAGVSRFLVTIRWRAGVTGRCRVRYEGLLLNVTAPPRMLGRRIALELDCQANEDGRLA